MKDFYDFSIGPAYFTVYPDPDTGKPLLECLYCEDPEWTIPLRDWGETEAKKTAAKFLLADLKNWANQANKILGE